MEQNKKRHYEKQIEPKSKRHLGEQMEEYALSYLEKNGMRIVERNFYSRRGEIDLIGYHKGYLVFVEVKYRKHKRSGTPESAVTLQKQQKICRAADYYRYLHHYGDDRPFRYDVVAIENQEVRWYENAFEHIRQYGDS
ncbi:MAG: YraN family protein [Lachnospiraceae bacterium]|nr:YraN family protein [Lachnospiraceae bacterium]